MKEYTSPAAKRVSVMPADILTASADILLDEDELPVQQVALSDTKNSVDIYGG